MWIKKVLKWFNRVFLRRERCSVCGKWAVVASKEMLGGNPGRGYVCSCGQFSITFDTPPMFTAETLVEESNIEREMKKLERHIQGLLEKEKVEPRELLETMHDFLLIMRCNL